MSGGSKVNVAIPRRCLDRGVRFSGSMALAFNSRSWPESFSPSTAPPTRGDAFGHQAGLGVDVNTLPTPVRSPKSRVERACPPFCGLKVRRAFDSLSAGQALKPASCFVVCFFFQSGWLQPSVWATVRPFWLPSKFLRDVSCFA